MIVKSFIDNIDNIDTDPTAAILVAGVIAPAKALGLRTTAEGVERSTQLAALRELGCDTAQGYLISRPLPPDQLDTALLQNQAGNDQQPTNRPHAPVHAVFTPTRSLVASQL